LPPAPTLFPYTTLFRSRSVTGRPIAFAGIGEKTDALEPFHPDRLASRILGMGDVLSLVERAQEGVDQTKAEELVRKLREDAFTLDRKSTRLNSSHVSIS